MIRPIRSLLVAALAPLVLPALPGIAEGTMSVKVSASRQDPDVRVVDDPAEGPLRFHVFVDGGQTRGGEFGLVIEGARFQSFEIDTAEVWATMPMRDPYPGTIAQALAGSACAGPPTYFGCVTVIPDEPGGRVAVDVIPSLRSNQASVLGCENEAIQELQAFPATVNGGGDNLAPHALLGDVDGEPAEAGAESEKE